MPLIPIESFTMPTEAKGVLEGWEQKRLFKRATDSTELKDTGAKAESKEEAPKPFSQPAKAFSLPEAKDPKPRIKPDKLPSVPKFRKPPYIGVPKLVRTKTKTLDAEGPKISRPPRMDALKLSNTKVRTTHVEWTTSVPTLPKTAVELPPPKPLSRRKKAETHLFNSIIEYEDLTTLGESQTDALNKSTQHAQSIIRNFESKLFDTEQLLSQATIAQERELEEKMNRLFASIATKTKACFKDRGESGEKHTRIGSREATSNPSL